MKNRVTKTGWLIIDRKKQRIWKQMYYTKTEAEAELKSQIEMIKRTRPTFAGENWKIEPMEYTVIEEKTDPLRDF